MANWENNLTEVEMRPHQIVQECDHRINDLLAQIVIYQQQENRTLKAELARLQATLDAQAAGTQAASEGQPITANPYMPDEDDRWVFWRQGWELGCTVRGQGIQSA